MFRILSKSNDKTQTEIAQLIKILLVHQHLIPL